MKITKYVHSCLLVETDDRVALFDPGVYSRSALADVVFSRLDDILITHTHPDHFDIEYIHDLVQQFPNVHITAPTEIVAQLAERGIAASDQPSDGIAFFTSPHEQLRPWRNVDPPQEYGYHYLNQLSHPGDSHSFTETKTILALPVQAPWGSTVRAVELGLQLKPQHILPIHDWHWNDQNRQDTYELLEQRFAEAGITFHKLVTGVPVIIDLA